MQKKKHSHTPAGSRGAAITWANIPSLRSPALMGTNGITKKVYDPCTRKLSQSLLTQWAESNHTLSLQICLGLLGVSGATSLLHRCHSPPRMFSEFLLRKVLFRQLVSHLCSLVEHARSDTTPLIPHNGHLGWVLPSQQGKVIKTQDKVPPDWTWHIDNVTLLQVVGCLPKVNHLPPLIQGENATKYLTFKLGSGSLTNTS